MVSTRELEGKKHLLVEHQILVLVVLIEEQQIILFFTLEVGWVFPQSVYSCVSLEKTSAMSVGVSCVGEVTSMSLDSRKLDYPPRI